MKNLEKTPKGILDRFIRKVNQKGKPAGRCPPGLLYFKGRIFENPSNKKVSDFFKKM